MNEIEKIYLRAYHIGRRLRTLGDDQRLDNRHAIFLRKSLVELNNLLESLEDEYQVSRTIRSLDTTSLALEHVDGLLKG